MKKYYNKEHYEPIVTIEEQNINRVKVKEGIAKIKIWIIEQLLEKISKNIKKKNESAK